MRRTSVIALLHVVLCFAAANCGAQIFFPWPYPGAYPRPYQPRYVDPNAPMSPVEIGAYGLFGGALDETPPPNNTVGAGSIGLYGQWNRIGLCPGLDARLEGSVGHLHGGLFGPRLGYQPRGRLRDLRPYVEVLAGQNELPRSATDTSTIFDPPASETALPSYRGVRVAAVIGLDLDYGAAVRWRVIEFSKGDFTGLAGSQPATIMTGIVIHLP